MQCWVDDMKRETGASGREELVAKLSTLKDLVAYQEGSINGAGNYGFMLTAIDGDLKGRGNSDMFRIKIWDKATGMLIYDNQYGSSDAADPTTAIAGGSIV